MILSNKCKSIDKQSIWNSLEKLKKASEHYKYSDLTKSH